MQRKTEEDYRALAKTRGFQWAGGELPEDVLQRTEWTCSHGHRFSMRYANVYQGRACPVCTRRWRRKRDDYRRMGESHGLSLVGKSLPSNTRQATYWRLPHESGGGVIKLSYRSLAVRRRRIVDLDGDELNEMIIKDEDVDLYEEGDSYAER